MRPTCRGGRSGNVCIIRILIAQTIAPLILHRAPVGHWPLAIRGPARIDRRITAIENRSIGGTARSVDAVDDDLRIPAILLVAETVAVIAAKVINVDEWRIQTGVC